MNRQLAMVLAGFVTTLAVVGGTVAAAQSGVLSTSTTTIQANGEINVPKTAPIVVALEPTAVPAVHPTEAPDVEIITRTEVMPIQYITKTVVVEKRDTAYEAALTAKLNQAYKIVKDRDTAYQAKLQQAYSQLIAAQAAAQEAQASAANSSQTQAQANPAPSADSAPTSQHKDDHQDGGDQHSDDR